MIKKNLEARGYKVNTINYGQAGTTSQHARTVLEDTLLIDQPDIVVIASGLVDSLLLSPPPACQTNLEKMIVYALASEAKAILGKIDLSCHFWKGSEYISHFNAIYDNLAGLYSIPIFNFLDSYNLGSKEFNCGDYIHPKGHQRISLFLVPELVKIIDQLNKIESESLQFHTN